MMTVTRRSGFSFCMPRDKLMVRGVMSISETELLSRAVEGDASALRALLKRFGPQAREAIRGKIDKRWQSVLDEDDVMQVAYLEAFLHIDQLTGRDPASFVAWLSK